MNCIGPVTPGDFELLAYADNDASPAVRQHLAACYACRVRALELGREQLAFKRLLHRAGCPSPLNLGEYYLALLAEDRAAQVREHLLYCPACRIEVSDLAAFLVSVRRRPAAPGREALGSHRTIIALLSTAALGGPGFAFVPATRGPGDDSQPTPVVYVAEDILVTVDSWIERTGQPGRTVAGLLVGPVDLKNAEASMTSEHMPPATATVDELGNFLFSGVAPGPHNLMIRLPATGLEIQIDELAVK